MPLKSNLSLEKFGFLTFPANKTFLHLFTERNLKIFPNRILSLVTALLVIFVAIRMGFKIFF